MDGLSDMARVLVTGANGFIGLHLVRRLTERGEQVTCLTRPTSNVTALSAFHPRFVTGDVTSAETLPAALDGIDVVYHLAGLTCALRRDELFRVNAEGIRNVAAACAAQPNPPRLIHVSSLAASRPTRDGIPVLESDLPAPPSAYGQSKRAGELAASQFADRVPTTIVRPPMVFGEGDKAMLPIFASVARWRIHMAPSFRSHRYSLIHVDDLVTGLLAVADRGKRLENGANKGQGIYFIAADETPSYADLGRLVNQALGRRGMLVIRNFGTVIWTIAAVSETIGRLRGKPLPFNWDKAREARAGSWVCSTNAIRADVGFAPAAPLLDRLRQTADWYRREKWL
jgi:dihydroflavonol-4-reductase